ncbi:MAG: acetylglutamate kinase [Bacillota bacterium]|nr:acetylglutamate kinase [Bacillota bacterium]MDD3298047.1 acetylglutamate kinase [Bacillota bacterium]MDD3850496.1 acetylglutamate kinase [Bacillota bacterium]MDD4707726.1 acetylglutamate kinase [Bacillota bacterium]
MINGWQEKAAVLMEALPYIKRFYGKRIVIKYGGNAMVNAEYKDAIMKDIVLMKYVGMKPIVVHGGGPAINEMLERVGKKSSFVNGLRITDEETMEIAQMVLAGKINKEIVTLINKHGAKAVGLCGKDSGLMRVEKQYAEVKEGNDTTRVDIGLVGEVREVDTEILDVLTDRGFIPVVAPVGMGPGGQSYNVNADYAAGAIAGALKADKFVLVTDVEGIMDSRGGEKSLISSINREEAERLMEEGVITGGMIPKVECCLQALDSGVERIHIINGTVMHSLLLEIFTESGIGTMIEK